MKRMHTLVLPVAALVAVVALAGCKKPQPAPDATTTTPPPMSTTPLPPATTAVATVTSLELGSAAGADMKITAPKSTFAPRDKIIAAVHTDTPDPTVAMPVKLAAKWSHLDSNQTVNEESRDVQLKGPQVFDFEITNTDPWPTGKYKVEVMFDGNVIQAREFEVK